jgi:DNA-binding transcriptional regulator YiaG
MSFGSTMGKSRSDRGHSCPSSLGATLCRHPLHLDKTAAILPPEMVDGIETLLRTKRIARRLPAPPERRAIRRAASITQQELADAMGVTRSAVVRWEDGSRTPRGSRGAEYMRILDRLAAEARAYNDLDPAGTPGRGRSAVHDHRDQPA